jgi:predicted PurR-regulated permease PerM
MNPAPTTTRVLWLEPATWGRVALVAAALVVAFIAVTRLGTLLRLLAVAYLFAYLFHPVIVRLERARVPRAVGIALVYALVIGLLAVLGALLASVGAQVALLAQTLPERLAQTRASLEQLEQASPLVRTVIEQASAGAQAWLASLGQNLEAFVRGSGARLLGGAFGAVSGVLEGLVALVVGGYVLAGFEGINRFLLSLLPTVWQPLARSLSDDVSRAVGGYLRGQVLIALLIGAMIALAMTVIGEPLALAIGFIAGLFNVVPYLGVVIAIVPALLLAVPGGWGQVLLVAAVFLAVNQLEGHVFSPLILARATDLNPVSVVAAVLAGLSLGGIWGGVVAVPLAALVKLLVLKYWLPSRAHGSGSA